MENPYVRPSPIIADRGENIGVAPQNLSYQQLEALGHPKNPLKAIRAHCVGCSNGVISEVNKCHLTDCPLWPMRMGRNPFHAQSKHSQNKDEAPVAFKQSEASETPIEKDLNKHA